MFDEPYTEGKEEAGESEEGGSKPREMSLKTTPEYIAQTGPVYQDIKREGPSKGCYECLWS